MPSRRIKRNKINKKNRFKTNKKISDNNSENRFSIEPTLFTDVPYKWGETWVKDKLGGYVHWEKAYLGSRRPLQYGENNVLTNMHSVTEFDELLPERQWMPDGTSRIAMKSNKNSGHKRKIWGAPNKFNKTIK